MGKVIIEFSDQEKMRIEAILMDNDAEEALRFLGPLENLWVKSRDF